MKRFFKAINKGNEEEVSRLLDADPTLLERESRLGKPPLVAAVHTGRLGMVKLLVRKGANIDATGKWGMSALLSAIEGGREDIVSFLVSEGAWTGGNEDGVTPLGLAFWVGLLGVMSILLPHMGEQGLQETTEMGWTALMAASASGQLCAVQVLVEEMKGQGLDEQDQKGRTALHWAAKGGHEEVVTLLLDNGGQADIGDENRTTPFMEAAANGHLGVVQLLLQHMGGQGLDATNIYGMTALHHAVEGGHEAVVTFLLSQGAEAINADSDGMTPFMLAAARGHVGMAQVFLELQGGQGLDEGDITGNTALHSAVRRGHAEAAAWLLRNGAGASVRDDKGMTPLMEVGESGHRGTLEILLQEVGEQGLRERDVAGNTALHWAARCDHEEVVQALLLAGADPTIKDNEGKTPRALAEERGHDECVDVFEWSEGQLERRYILQRAWCIHDAYMTHQEKPSAPLPAFLQDRVAAGQALPEVEMSGGHQEEQPAATSGKREAHQGKQVAAVLEYVVARLRDAPLFKEFMQYLHAPRNGLAAVGEDDDDDEEEEEEEDGSVDDSWEEDGGDESEEEQEDGDM